MLKIWFADTTDGYIHFKLEGDSFIKLIDLFKSRHIQFDNVTKSFYCEPNIECKELYETLMDYEDNIVISNDDKDLIEHITIYPPSNDLKKVKYSVDKELLELHPPIKGVFPNEDYQLKAIKFLTTHSRAFLNIYPRLGKSYISLISIGTLMKLDKLDCVLCIMRSEGLANFESEILRFLPFINENDIITLNKDRRNIEDYFDKKFILCSYNTWRLVNEYYKKERKITSKKPKKPFIKFEKWLNNRMLLLDECQSICGDTLQSHYSIIHSNLFEKRCVMSGSIGYNMEKTYNLAKILTPNRLSMSKSEWWNYITVPTYSQYKRDIVPERLKEFQDEVLNPITITFGKECLEEVENYEHIIYINMNDKMRENYQNICNEFIYNCAKENNGKISIKQLKQKFPYLKQATDDMSLMNVAHWNMEKDNPKIEVLSSFLEKKIDEEGRGVILWCNSPRTMQKLKEIYSKYNPICVSGDEKLCGIKRENRNKVIEEIKTSKTCKLLIANEVLSTSVSFWNFSVNCWFSMPLNPDYFLQANRRIFGSQQQRDCETVYLLFTHSIDNYLYESLKHKIETKNYFDSDEDISMDKLKDIINPKHRFTLEGGINYYN